MDGKRQIPDRAHYFHPFIQNIYVLESRNLTVKNNKVSAFWKENGGRRVDFKFSASMAFYPFILQYFKEYQKYSLKWELRYLSSLSFFVR